MKKALVFAGLVMVAAAGFGQTLDTAIQEAARGVSERLPDRATVVMVEFLTDSERLTNYVIDEMNDRLVTIGRIRPVERRQLNAIRAELNLSTTGEVSDATAQRIGQMAGAQYLIMGSIDYIGNQYLVRFRAIPTETAVIEWTFTQNIVRDRVLTGLLRSGTQAATTSGTTAQTDLIPGNLAYKISAGGVLGITSSNETYHYDNGNIRSRTVTDVNLLMPTLNLRLLLPFESKLRTGLGLDVAFGLLKLPTNIDAYIIMSGTLAPYAIIGYSNAYLHAGYDFAYGALYLAPSFIINKHLMLGVPMSIFGNNRNFGIASLIAPVDNYDSKQGHYIFESKMFQIGVSFQYVF